MKKLLIILLATVLLAGLTPPAQAALTRVGPVSVATGYPLWYEDATGLRLELCLDQNGMCLAQLPNPALPASVPGNYDPAGEAFYWLAEATIANPGVDALLILAMEAAFLGGVQPGGQVAFARIRIRMTPTQTGSFTVTHPYGTITVNGVAGVRQVITQDIGIGIAIAQQPAPQGGAALPDDPAQAGTVNANGASIGPFLRPTTAPIIVGGITYLAQPGVPVTVTGGPNGNAFTITGPGIIGGTTNLFDMQAKVSGCLDTNVAPIAAADLGATATGQAKAVSVTGNDTAGSNPATAPATPVPINPASILITAPPASGTAVKNPDGTVSYTPNANFFGQDSFTYTVQDMCALTSNAVAVPVMVEKLVAGKAEFRARTGKWSITGTSSLTNVPLPAPGQPNLIRLRKGAPTGPIIGTVPVQANGSWRFQGKSKVSPGAVPQTIHVESTANVIINSPLKMK